MASQTHTGLQLRRGPIPQPKINTEHNLKIKKRRLSRGILSRTCFSTVLYQGGLRRLISSTPSAFSFACTLFPVDFNTLSRLHNTMRFLCLVMTVMALSSQTAAKSCCKNTEILHNSTKLIDARVAALIAKF